MKKKRKKTAQKRGKAARRKGRTGEQELAKLLASLFPGTETRRRQQYSGTEGTDDVVFIEGLHVECKRSESFNAYKALEQATDDAGEGALPFVCHRRNGKPWIVVSFLDDLPSIAEKLKDYVGNDT